MVDSKKYTKKVRKDLRQHKLEEFEPGATREEFLTNLKKVASTPKLCPKHNPQKA